jgi:hypothetical protein
MKILKKFGRLLGNSWNGWSDTLSDIVNGAIGAGVAYVFFKNKSR